MATRFKTNTYTCNPQQTCFVTLLTLRLCLNKLECTAKAKAISNIEYLHQFFWIPIKTLQYKK